MGSLKPVLSTATLISREHVAPGFWYLGFHSPAIARSAAPASYVAVDVPGAFVVRLPLGIWTASGDEFSLLFREWGDRTRRLAQLSVGSEVSCIGPLGNQFTIPARGSRAVIVAGGIGIVPFWLLGRDLLTAGVKVLAIVGARTKAMLAGVGTLRDIGLDVRVCTDDGSEGEKATAIDVLRKGDPMDMIYGCGPPGMLRALCRHAVETRTACEISMEETFGCSLGTCWGCVVPVRRGCPQGTGYPPSPRDSRTYDLARVCTDGTVFAAADVMWLEA
jgi:dihydroorotate dehydrogenase electron transfer subunit